MMMILVKKAQAQIKCLSKGALTGGFTREGLEFYAKRLWKEEEQDIETDLFSHNLSVECSQWLDSHNDASGELAKAYFGSIRFLPERILMIPFFINKTNLPETFSEKERFLAWEVKRKDPLEIICSWELGRIKGLTMMAFDPQIKRLYQGNSIAFDRKISKQTHVFSLILNFHAFYANYLLVGMAKVLEKKSK